MEEINSRKEYLDIAKGFLIIFVVLGHTYDFRYDYILYWFHIPAFFIISGILHKDNKLSIKIIVKKFVVPYLVFSIISIFMYFITFPYQFSIIKILELLIRYLYSGKLIEGIYWFIPTLIMTKIIFGYLHRTLDRGSIIYIMVLMYFAAHFISLFIIPRTILNFPISLSTPWNVDVLLMTIPFYCIGYYVKNYEKYLSNTYVLLVLCMLCTTFIVFNEFFNIEYYLDIKFSQYRFILLDLLIPVIFSLFILSLSTHICLYDRLLSYIGRKVGYIMYLHLPINMYLYFTYNFSYMLLTITGIVFPILISILFDGGKNKDIYTKHFKHKLSNGGEYELVNIKEK